METSKFQDVIDLSFLQKFQDLFSGATGMASISVDLEAPITTPSNFTDFCIKHTRGSKEGFRRCVECDLMGGEKSKLTGKPAVYYCHAGLVDFAAPIVVNGRQVGSILGGQVLPAPPDEDKFRKIAVEIGVDPDEYIEALRKIKIVSEDKINHAAELLYLTINQVIENRAREKKAVELNNALIEKINSAASLIESITRLAKELDTQIDSEARALKESSAITERIAKSIMNTFDISTKERESLEGLKNNSVQSQESMRETIQKIDNISKSVDGISDAIQIISVVAANSNLLSMNAAIEAAQAGAAGRGFAVVANEIRRLADSTRENSKNISQTLKSIINGITVTTEQSSYTEIRITEMSKEIGDFAQTMTVLIDTLKGLSLESNEIVASLSTLREQSSVVKINYTRMSSMTENLIGMLNELSAMTMETPKFQDVIDLSFLQKFQDLFSGATGMASISVDLEAPITTPSNFTDFCIKHTRGSKEGFRRCVECDLMGGEKSKSTGKPAVYYCHAGLVDFAAPIVVNNQQVGSILGGQVLPAPPDEDKFRKIAVEIGVDPDEYIEALRKIKIVSEDKINHAAELLYFTIHQVIENHAKEKKAVELNIALTKKINSASPLIESITRLAKELDTQIDSEARALKDSSAITERIAKSIMNTFDISMKERESLEGLKNNSVQSQESMRETIQKIENISKSVDGISDAIQIISAVASNSNLLSMNAAIEAARAGAAGRGFSVVANEIRRLADSTRENSKNISRTLKSIINGITVTTEQSSYTETRITEMSKEIDDFAQTMTILIDTLKGLSLESNEIVASLSTLREQSSVVKTNYTRMSSMTENLIGSLNELSAMAMEK